MTRRLELPPEAYRNVLESLPTAVYLVDLDRRIIFWNDGCENLTGYHRHEVIGRCCADELLMHCDDQRILCCSACHLHETMLDGRPCERDVYLRHKDGNRVPVRVRAVPLRDDAGVVIGACECFDERKVDLPARRTDQRPSLCTTLDPVTQLPDRHAMLRALLDDLRDFEMSRLPFGVLCLSIDGFDRLVAADGANGAHSVLYVTAQTLADSIGSGNLVGRWADRQFLAIVRGCTEAGLREAAGLLTRLAGLDAVSWWGDRITITLSTGGAVVEPGDTLEDLIGRAMGALEANRNS